MHPFLSRGSKPPFGGVMVGNNDLTNDCPGNEIVKYFSLFIHSGCTATEWSSPMLVVL